MIGMGTLSQYQKAIMFSFKYTSNMQSPSDGEAYRFSQKGSY